MQHIYRKVGAAFAALLASALFATACHEEAVGPCNRDGVCDAQGGETRQGCPEDCLTCNNDGICDVGEPPMCDDCASVACGLWDISGDPQDFLVSEVFVPQSASAARENGVDLDGDGVVDNKLGSIAELLVSQVGDLGLSEWVNQRIQQGELIILSRVYPVQWGYDDDPVLAQVFQGEVVDASPVFDGHDTVAIADSSPTDLYLCGRMVGDELQAGPENLRLVIPVADGTPLDFTLLRVEMIGDVTADGMTDVMIGAGIYPSDITDQFPEIADALNAVITDPTRAADTVSTILSLLDGQCETEVEGCDPLPHGCAEDGAITVAELQCNAVVQQVLLPDVDFGDEDPSNDLLSLGLRIVSAVPVTVQQ